MRPHGNRDRLAIPVNGQDHTLGPQDAPITLVEYGDYECPFCGAAYPATVALLEEMRDRVLFVYRHFPLATVHPHATGAALAAEAAGRQGKFWEMHHLLFQHQDALEEDDLWAYAEAIGLDMDQFENDFRSEACAQRVQQDFMGGVRTGVNGTPSFFINGYRHEGGSDYQSLALAVEEAATSSVP